MLRARPPRGPHAPGILRKKQREDGEKDARHLMPQSSGGATKRRPDGAGKPGTATGGAAANLPRLRGGSLGGRGLRPASRSRTRRRSSLPRLRPLPQHFCGYTRTYAEFAAQLLIAHNPKV